MSKVETVNFYIVSLF